MATIEENGLSEYLIDVFPVTLFNVFSMRLWSKNDIYGS